MGFETPAGRTGEMRKMKIKDEDILTDIQLSKQGKTLDALLDNCIESDFPLKKMLIGERVFLIVKLRSISLGTEFIADLNCAKCGDRFKDKIDLSKLKIQKLDKKKVKVDDKGNYIFETKPLPDLKKKVTLRLLIGDDENRIQQIRKNYPDEYMSRLWLLRIVSIEGKEGLKSIHWVKELSVADSRVLRDEYLEHDCGVWTEIEVVCKNCYANQIVSLPVDSPDFFLPSTRRQEVS